MSDPDRDPRVMGFDVSGDGLIARLSDSRGAVLSEWREPLPARDSDGTAMTALVAETVRKARRRSDVHAAGLVVPGDVDALAGIVTDARELDWRDVAIRDLVADALDLPIGFAQSARAGALAEATTGAGAGVAGPVVYVPLDRNVSATVTVDGVPVEPGVWSGEIGQIVISRGPHKGRRIDRVVSATAVARRAGESDWRVVAARVRDGKHEASEAWAETIEVLADALTWITAIVGPSMIVVGGELANADDLLFTPLHRALDDRLGTLKRPRVVRSVHGGAAGVIGATHLARRALRESLGQLS